MHPKSEVGSTGATGAAGVRGKDVRWRLNRSGMSSSDKGASAGAEDAMVLLLGGGVAKGKERSLKTTCLDVMTRRVVRSKQRWPW